MILQVCLVFTLLAGSFNSNKRMGAVLVLWYYSPDDKRDLFGFRQLHITTRWAGDAVVGSRPLRARDVGASNAFHHYLSSRFSLSATVASKPAASKRVAQDMHPQVVAVNHGLATVARQPGSAT
jgi:hypothetical protein